MIRDIWIKRGTPPMFVARQETAGGTPLTISQVSSFSVGVYDLNSETPGTAVYTLGAIPTASGYFDTLQHDDAENLLGDSGGYNFKYVIATDEFAFSGSKLYRVQIVSQIGNSNYPDLYNVNVVPVFS